MLRGMKYPTSKTTLLLLIASLSGCISTYKPPAEGLTAQLVSEQKRPIYLFDNDQCKNPAVSPMGSEGKVTVHAAEPIFIAQRWSSGGMVTGHCKSMATFVPTPGATYRLRFNVNILAGSCPLDVDSLSPSGEATPVTLRYFNHPDCDNGFTQP
jgi:hypothetical protein